MAHLSLLLFLHQTWCYSHKICTPGKTLLSSRFFFKYLTVTVKITANIYVTSLFGFRANKTLGFMQLVCLQTSNFIISHKCCDGVYCFHGVHPSVNKSVTLQRFLHVLITQSHISTLRTLNCLFACTVQSFYNTPCYNNNIDLDIT